MNTTQYLESINTAIDARAAYERDKNAANDSMQDCLKQIRKSVSHERIAEIMLASNVDVNLINRSERVNARYNVYAYEKVVNVARALAKVNALNHYTRAIFLTALSFERNDLIMTQHDAQCACSKDFKAKDVKRAKHVVRYEKCVAANTVTTQSSSSLNALVAYDVLSESRDESNNATYRVNRESSATIALAALLDAKL